MGRIRGVVKGQLKGCLKEFALVNIGLAAMYRKWTWTLCLAFIGTVELQFPIPGIVLLLKLHVLRLTLQRYTEWKGKPLHLCNLNNSSLGQIQTSMPIASLPSLWCNPSSWSTAPEQDALSSTGRLSRETLPFRGELENKTSLE